MQTLQILQILTIATVVTARGPDLPVLQTIFNFLGGSFLGLGGNGTHTPAPKDVSQMTPEELGQSRGVCHYDFLNRVRWSEATECERDDHYITHLLPLPSIADGIARKPPILVKCLIEHANITNETLLMMSSVKDIVALLKPIGNATKRHEPGSCVLVLFYTPTSLSCSHVAPFANVLPMLFPMLRVAAIDALRFPNFNTEFGIVGLPTLLLFHQGRPIVKFYSEAGTFAAFVTRHTGIKPVDPLPLAVANVSGPLPLQPVQQTDYILVLAWVFILLCLGNYFAKSRLCTQIVEMIKRNWRESEAQLEHN